MSWTDELRAEAKALYVDHSARQIAELLNAKYRSTLPRTFTRNSVIGCLHRMGVTSEAKTKPHPFDTRSPARKRAEPRSGAKPRVRKSKLHIVSNGGGGMRIMESVVSDLPELRCAEVMPTIWVDLGDLKSHHCRWPYGDGPGYVFCGHSKMIGSYCWNHYKLSVGNGTPSERAAHKVSRRQAA